VNFYDKRNAQFWEEAEEGSYNLQAVWQAQLSHPRQGMLSLRVREVRKSTEIRLAVEDRRGQEK